MQVVDKSTQNRRRTPVRNPGISLPVNRDGLGYGWLPQADIQPLLDSGELCYLTEPPKIRTTPLYFVRNPENRYDPVVSALADALPGPGE